MEDLSQFLEEAIERAALSPMRSNVLKWTRKLPQTRGWYWCSRGDGLHRMIVSVYPAEGKMFARSTDGVTRRISSLAQVYPLWAGPILAPEEQDE